MSTDAERSARARALDLMYLISACEGAGLSLEMPLSSIGFDSLAFAELAVALREELGVDLSSEVLEEKDTVGEVLAAVERQAAAGRRRADGIPPGLGRFQIAGRTVTGGLIRAWFRVQVRGADRIPRHGPVILAMNHESALDIPVVTVTSPRPIYFMAKRELFRHPLVGRLFHEFGAFCVDRGRFDLEAIEIALGVLSRGEVLGMYPEGTRSPGVLLPFLRGAAWAALRTGAPILPAAITGTEKAGDLAKLLGRRLRVGVSFGQIMRVEPSDDPRSRLEEAARITDQLRKAILAMLAR